MKAGENLTFVVGTGHGLCTCAGAAFEYIFNLEFEIRKAGMRERARIVLLTNEAELGDFGVDGLSSSESRGRIHAMLTTKGLSDAGRGSRPRDGRPHGYRPREFVRSSVRTRRA